MKKICLFFLLLISFGVKAENLNLVENAKSAILIELPLGNPLYQEC